MIGGDICVYTYKKVGERLYILFNLCENGERKGGVPMKDTLDYMVYRAVNDLSSLYVVTTEIYEIRAERAYSDDNIVYLDVYKEQRLLVDVIINQQEKTFEFTTHLEDVDVHHIYRALTTLLSLEEVY